MFRDAAAAVRELLHPRRDPAVHQLQVSPDQSEHGIWSRDPVLTSDWLQVTNLTGLPHLRTLDLSHNCIRDVEGLHTKVGQILDLDLSHNR